MTGSEPTPQPSLAYATPRRPGSASSVHSSFDRAMRILGWVELLCLLAAVASLSMLVARWLHPAPDSDAENGIEWEWVWTALSAVGAFALVVALRAILTGDANIILKQMRQRALGTWLTLLSVLLGVALAIAVLLVNRESGRLFGQTDFGYELIIGPPKGSKLTLVLNTVYHLEQSEGVVPYSLYEELATRDTDLFKMGASKAVPFMVGDSYMGRRIVGTSPQMFGFNDAGKPLDVQWQYRRDHSFELAAGRVFHPKRFEAVIGSEAAQTLAMSLYDPSLGEVENEKRHALFQATHGMPAPGQEAEIHKPKWKVVGILKPTGTANDRVVFVPTISLYAISEHSIGMLKQSMQRAGIDPNSVDAESLPQVLKKLGYEPEKIPKSVYRAFRRAGGPSNPPATQPATEPATGPASAPSTEEEADAYHLDSDGNIVPDLPREDWTLSAVLVKTRGAFATEKLLDHFKVINTDAQAASPARVMRDFFDTFLKNTTYVLLALAALVSIVAAVSILVSIYNSVAARQKEIAILRALGATRGKVLGLICLEAGVIGLVGGVLGFLTGHALGAIGSGMAKKVIGEGINWWEVDRYEVVYLAGVVLVAVIAGLVPALKAYRVPVVTNLTAG